jgi:hypothetical protein
MSRTTSAADGGGIATELRNWARGRHSAEAAVELLIRARRGRFVDPSQPWLRTDDRGIVWLDAQVISRYSHAVSSGERHILALVEALATGEPLGDIGGLMASLDPYHLDLVLAVLRHVCCGSEPTHNSAVPRQQGSAAPRRAGGRMPAITEVVLIDFDVSPSSQRVLPPPGDRSWRLEGCKGPRQVALGTIDTTACSVDG